MSKKTKKKTVYGKIRQNAKKILLASGTIMYAGILITAIKG